MLIEQYFSSNGHDFNRAAKFTIIETREKKKHELDNISVIIEKHEDKSFKRFRTLTPNGFNIQVNHPQNTTLK